MVTFLSKDKKHFECPLNIAIMSNTIKNIIEDCTEDQDDENNNIIPLTNIKYDDIVIIFNFLESVMYKENPFELNNDSLYIFNNSYLPMMINNVNFLDIEPLLNLLASIFAYRTEETYYHMLKESNTVNEINRNLFYNLPDEMVLLCLKKFKTSVLFKLCMLCNAFWYFMMMIPDINFNFIECDPEDVSVFLEYIKTLNQDDITKIVINIFTTGLSINNDTDLVRQSRTLFFDFLMECPLFLTSINFENERKEFTDLVLALFNYNDPIKFEKICKASFNPDNLEGFNFNLYCITILEKRNNYLAIIKKYIEMLQTTFNNDLFEEIDYQCLHECSLLTGHYDITQFAFENGAEFIEYDENFDNDFGSFLTPGSISYAIVGNNMDCVKYTIDAFKNRNTGLLFLAEWKNYIKWSASHGTLEILEYIITNIDGIQDIFDNFYGYILEWALSNGNITIVQYALDNGAIFTDDIHTRIIEYNMQRPYKYISDEEDMTDFNYYTLSLSNKTKYNIEKCMAIIHSHNNQ